MTSFDSAFQKHPNSLLKKKISVSCCDHAMVKVWLGLGTNVTWLGLGKYHKHQNNYYITTKTSCFGLK